MVRKRGYCNITDRIDLIKQLGIHSEHALCIGDQKHLALRRRGIMRTSNRCHCRQAQCAVLLMQFPGVLDLIDVMAGIRLFQDIHGAVIVVIAESGLTDNRDVPPEGVLCILQHGMFVRNPRSRTVCRHFLIRAEHTHRPVAKVVSGIQARLHLRRDDPQARLMPVQPEHLRALHAPHEIRLGYRHISLRQKLLPA